MAKFNLELVESSADAGLHEALGITEARALEFNGVIAEIMEAGDDSEDATKSRDLKLAIEHAETLEEVVLIAFSMGFFYGREDAEVRSMGLTHVVLGSIFGGPGRNRDND